MPPRLSPKFLAAVVVAFLVLIGNAWLATRHREQATERVVTVREQIRVTDTLYRRDTIVRRQTLTRWQTVRDSALGHDTTTIVRTLAATCDSALRADSAVIRVGEVRDSLHRVLEKELPKALAPKPFTLHAEAYTDQTYRVGASLRVVKALSLVGEVEQRRDVPLTARLGVRVVF